MPSNKYYVPDIVMPGYLLAFRGKTFLSKLIMVLSPGVSHAETIAHNIDNDELESFSAIHTGTRFIDVESVIRNAKGSVYLLQLRQEVIDKMEMGLFNALITDLDNVPYDVLHFIGTGVDDWHINLLKYIPKFPKWVLRLLKGMFHNSPTVKKVVCSSVYAWAMKQALNLSINPSEQTPLDICQWNIFEPNYITLKGKDKGIKKYNTVGVL